MSQTTETTMDEMVDDILTAAFEGGINYWCPHIWVMKNPEPPYRPSQFGVGLLNFDINTAEMPSRGGWLAIADDEYEWHPLNRAAIIRGIRNAAKDFRQSVRVFHENHDAEGADIAVQYALFGEVIYG